ncbi:MAG: hydroxypyruvate isomerase family protein [Beijerinckiaceae bacterium]|nr:hydroxypyruvate isomerase family protein [Beijerinckiaceae bacterium]
MPRFAANLSMMFNEHPFLDRFAAAAEAGFEAVEFLFPYEHPPEVIADHLKANKLTQALFNLPPGDFAAGERGIAALPARAEEFREGVSTALEYAKATGVKHLHMMAGIADRHDPAAEDAYRKAVAYAAGELHKHGLDLLLEPINGRDMPGYFLNDFDFAKRLIEEMALPNLKLQFDIYHRQIMHGDVTMAMRAMMPMIGHVQLAGVPGRHEPVGCEIDYAFLYDELDALGYTGFIGCEYRPKGTTLAGLHWFQPYRTGTTANHLAGAVS